MVDAHVDELFGAIDTNGNGVLSLDETRATDIDLSRQLPRSTAPPKEPHRPNPSGTTV
ncbi:MAG: EF-hand domain-containing protein [Candidatus Competibacterales bacterium]